MRLAIGRRATTLGGMELPSNPVVILAQALCLLLTLCLLSCDGEDATPERNGNRTYSVAPAREGVSGTVTDRHDHPIEGVEVTVKLGSGAGYRGWKEGASADTAEDGTFQLDVDGELGLVHETVAFLSTKKEGYLPFVQKLERFRPGDRRRLRIQLVRGGSIRGRIVTEDGRPISDALVYGIHPKVPGAEREDIVPTTRSDADGGYLLPDVPPGPFCIGARAEGYAPAVVDPVTVTEAGVAGAPDLSLGPAGSISGFVRTPSGEPVFRATVRAWRARELRSLRLYGLATVGRSGGTAITARDGSFRIPSLPEADFLVDAEAMGHSTPEGEPEKVRCNGDPVELILTPGVPVKLVVVNSRTLETVTEYVVAITPLVEGDKRTVVEEIDSAEGLYEFRVLPGQKHQLEVSAPGFDVYVRELAFPEGSEPKLTVLLLPR